MNMNENDTDTGPEENGAGADELPEEAGKVEAEAGEAAAATEEESDAPWVPPTEEEHRALLDIKEKTDSIFEELLRAKAEFENYRKRQKQMAEKDRASAIRGLIAGLLPVIDNFERAIESADAEEGGEGGLLEGVGLIHQMILKLLEDNDVSVVEAQGRQFDPDFHEAVFEEEVAEGSTGDILDVLEKGYLHGEVLIRPSRVKVAKVVESDESCLLYTSQRTRD